MKQEVPFMSTTMPKAQNITRKWYVIDAADKPLGRTAAKAADLLRGKHKPIFAPHVDCGDHVHDGLVHIQDLIQRNVFHGEHLLQLFALCVQNMAQSRFLQRNGLDEIGNGLAHGDGVRGCCDGGH